MNRSRLFCSFPMTCECGSWKASFRFCARIGTMNHPLTPSHSLNGGEGGRRPGEGAVHGEGLELFLGAESNCVRSLSGRAAASGSVGVEELAARQGQKAGTKASST